jgi:hypothetical protein
MKRTQGRVLFSIFGGYYKYLILFVLPTLIAGNPNLLRSCCEGLHRINKVSRIGS